MIISNNKDQFETPPVMSPAVATGKLRTYQSPSVPTNELFLGFKSSSVCKDAGYLTVNGSGFYLASVPDLTVTLSIEFSKAGNSFGYFEVPVLSLKTTKAENFFFTFHADIPVGAAGIIPVATLTTSHVNNTSRLFDSYGYITTDKDDVWIASFKYSITSLEPPADYGFIKLFSAIAEYKES